MIIRKTLRNTLPRHWLAAFSYALLAWFCGANQEIYGQQQNQEPNSLPSAVQTIFETRCVSCHNDDDLSGGLSLTHADAFRHGGDSGPAVDLDEPAGSYLLEQISGESPSMPQSGEPLTPAEIESIGEWIRSGAAWPADLHLEPRTAYEHDWWAWQPIVAVEPPETSDPLEAAAPTNPIDRFVARRLAENGLSFSPPANRQTLIRRVYFDLIGLPPTAEEVDRFVDSDNPQAYEQLVDQLLASPRYGERWARFWLDVAHYADSHGYDKDKPRENAWPYRDYVIRALNHDLPWSEFIQQQIAGDVLIPDSPDAFEALGFLAAGPWDFIGHEELPETKIDGQVARHLDRDDMVRTAIQSFCSVTVGCAQCHDHKFDPIPQSEYYALQATVAAIDRADQPYYRDAQLFRQHRQWAAQLAAVDVELKQLETVLVERGGTRWTALVDEVNQLKHSAGRNPSAAFGYHSQLVDDDSIEKWLQLDLGKPESISEIVLYPAYDDFNNIGAGFGFPIRYAVELSADLEFSDPILIADHLSADQPNPGLKPVAIQVPAVVAQYVRVRATKLAGRLPTDSMFALAEIEIRNDAGHNSALTASVSAADSIEAPPRWSRNYVIDGEYPQAAPELLQARSQQLEALRESLLTQDEYQRWTAARDEREQIKKHLAALPEPDRVYVAAVHHGLGNFAGTGEQHGRPREIQVLRRGNVTLPIRPIEPAALSLLPDWPGEFQLSADHRESDRRAALARWISSPQNHLTWRSVVNRVWQYHFGQGLVETPNDFGRMGGEPSHPQLLDWLAADFRDHDQSLKRLHRLIVTSRTYRQASQVDESDPRVELANSLDADNRLLWRMNRRKLEAEAVRDSILQVAGQLDLTMYGPGFRDFVIERPEHSPHYRYDLADPNDAETHRRSIYRFVVRSQMQPMLTSLDCADPSIQVGRRTESTTPLQSLVMLNDGLILAMCRHFAQRIEHGAEGAEERIRFAFRTSLGRMPTESEWNRLTEFTRVHGTENLARLLFNLNEFVFVD